MTRDDWRRIKDIAGDALEEPIASRAEYVAARCGLDQALLREVESLIASATRAEPLFEMPSVLRAGAEAAIDSLSRFDGPRPGERVGAYQIVCQLGGGGMGAAYLAVRADDEYEKRVAIKLIRRGMDSEVVLRRFRHERQILADLEHPNIARLLDGGTTANGLPYFVMEYVDGTPIDQHCDRGRLSIRERVILFRKVCDAVDYAHRHHVVHRDLKPSNILVTPEGEPKLLDFGIAKLLTPGASSGRTELTLLSRAMTPLYASPEQVRGEPVTPASDVYALGVLLYELLSGQRPYRLDGRTLREIEEVICRGELQPPSAVASDGTRGSLAGDLDNIALMALRKEPEGRYRSVKAFSDDLLSHLEMRPVRARANEAGYRAMKLLRRHRTRVIEAAVLVAAVTAGLFIAPWSNRAAPPITASSVAVLPFTIAASDRDLAYLSDGLTEGLIDSLSEYPALRVLSRDAVFASRHTGRDPQTLAAHLNAGAVVLGNVSQTGDAVTVDLQLLDGASGRPLWTDTYAGQLSSLVDLRERMTRAVISRLGLRVEGAPPLASRQTRDSAAYELYLKGRYVWNKRTEEGFRRGLEYFRQAIDRDPQYALAYTGLADCYNLLAIWGALPPVEAMPQVKDAALRAIAIDGALAEAHTSLAFVHWVYDWNWDAAAAEFQRALALDPEYSTAHDWYAYYLASTGNFADAIASIRRAKELEPVSLSISTDLGEIYYWAGQYPQAIAELQGVLDIEPDFAMARNILGLTYLKTGRVNEALEQLEAANRLASGPRMLSTLAYAYGLAGRHAEAQATADRLRAPSPERYTSAFSLALVHLGAGNRAQAVASLEQAFAERSDSMVILSAYPLLEPLRQDPRFQALVRRVGIPSRLPD
jgi:TolB-like protein/Flp pilus assembly protein TadD/tRNA A-37 threonylcarbamoyl transferase component Bud32